jgi:hypothetical protein
MKSKKNKYGNGIYAPLKKAGKEVFKPELFIKIEKWDAMFL